MKKAFLRQGYPEPLYGVSTANLRRLAKTVGRDLTLARELWETGNHDCKCLAILIGLPAACDSDEMDAFANACNSPALANLFAEVTLNRPDAREWIAAWVTEDASANQKRVGYEVLSFAADEWGPQEDFFFSAYLTLIEETILAEPVTVRMAMNSALISIGLRGGGLTDQAIGVATRSGAMDWVGALTEEPIPNALDRLVGLRRLGA
jgi:3-methyladenine DNA glycosylase AlkD